MGLPKVIFNVASSGLGRLAAAIEKVPGVVITGTSVAEGVTIGQSYQIFTLAEAEALGIDAENNPFAHKHLVDFYNETGPGAELWIMLVSDATTYEQMADVNEALAKKLIADAAGAIRVLGLCKKSTGTEIIADGMDADVKAGIIKLQALADYYALKYMPFRAVVSGNLFTGVTADLFDYQTADYPRVNMLIANNDAADEASIGLLLGRISRIPTQRSMARVKDGSIIDLEAFFTNGEPVESLTDAWDAIHDKGYTFFRNFPGRAGYYVTDDRTLTTVANDFSSLARGMVMDEAVLIANDVMTEELSEEVPLTADGKIHPAIVKTWQSNIERQIEGLMVAEGKLSGVKAFIDENQNILQNDSLTIRIDLQPVGYAKTIEVNIGFTVNLEQ